MNNPFLNSLSYLPIITDAKSRSITAENPTGEKGGGGKESSHLGPSRKGRPCITLKEGETATLAEINGSGILQHFWITVTDTTSAGFYVLRDLVLRMYWDGEAEPSVEVPLGDFFCSGFATTHVVNSLPIVCNPTRGLNCYFPMPFRKKALITIENQHPGDIEGFFYQFNYSLYDSIPNEAAYFHAQWRREPITSLTQDYVILDNVKGKGQYIGTYMALSTLQRYWWGEGEMKFYMDGDEEYPTICGTGLEDYFGGAWGFITKDGDKAVENTYSTPFLGYPFYSNAEDKYSDQFMGDCPPMRSLYRWHIMDPIRFDRDLKVTVQQIGVCNRGLFERQDDVASVAYWYQTEPHVAFKPLMAREQRWPR
ncbi:glycoside hydrolase family 172 protein [Terrilactibacillus laevilacticus]|uniref:Glycoside hydrolase family 172 protein n=2 Tax=Terrilactibacillus laevilacticus TaxID=1380157 RepID=A0ABW5PUL2_9BACI